MSTKNDIMKIKRILRLVITVLIIASCSSNQEFDTLILNGKIYDGSGGDPTQVDIGIIIMLQNMQQVQVFQ